MDELVCSVTKYSLKGTQEFYLFFHYLIVKGSVILTSE